MFSVGSTVDWAGNFTELAALAVGLRNGNNDALESALGFHIGRLDKGFALLLLTEKPKVHKVSLQGMTNQSGGREGLPGLTLVEDEARPMVDEKYKAERQKVWADYRNMSPEVQKAGMEWADYDAAWTAVNATKIVGPHRAAKIVPVIRHDENMSPAKQYPAGGGVAQFNLHEKAKWLVAAKVSADGDWETLQGWPPLKHALLTDNRAYAVKDRVMQLLAEV